MTSDVIAQLTDLLTGQSLRVPGSVRLRGPGVTARIVSRQTGSSIDVHVILLGERSVTGAADGVAIQLLDGERVVGEGTIDPTGVTVLRGVPPGTWRLEVDPWLATDDTLPMADEGPVPLRDDEDPALALDHPDPLRRLIAIGELSMRPDADQPDAAVRRGLGDPSPGVRQGTLNALVSVDPPDLVDVLLDALDDSAVQVQEAAAAHLAGRVVPDHLPRIVGRLVEVGFHAGAPLLAAVHGLESTAAAVGTAMGLASASPVTRAAASRLLTAPASAPVAALADGTAGSVGWMTRALPGRGDAPVVLTLASSQVRLDRIAGDAVTLTVDPPTTDEVIGVWLSGAAGPGWLLLPPGQGTRIATVEVASGADLVLIAGVVAIPIARLGEPAWRPWLELSVERDRSGGATRPWAVLLEDLALPPGPRQLIEWATRQSWRTHRLTTPVGPIDIDVLSGETRVLPTVVQPDAQTAAALHRLAVAELRSQTSSSPFWTLDTLEALWEIQALAPSLAIAPPEQEVIRLLGALPAALIAEGANLMQQLTPVLSQLANTADAAERSIIDRVSTELESTAALEELTRVRARPDVLARLSDQRAVLVAPDVVAARLLPDEPLVRTERAGDGLQVDVVLDETIAIAFARLKASWPGPGDDDNTRARELWHHLARFAASHMTDRNVGPAIGGDPASVLDVRTVLARLLLGRPAPPLSSRPPSLPDLFIGPLGGWTSATARRMFPTVDGMRVSLRSALPNVDGPVVIALTPERTCRAGALACAVTFSHEAPREAAALSAAIEGLNGGSNGESAAAADELLRAATAGVRLVAVARAARERLRATVLDQTDAHPVRMLTATEERRSAIEERLDQLNELDPWLPW